MMRGMIGALSRTIGLKGADTDGSKRDENTDGNAHPLKRSRFSVPNFLQPFANEVDYRLDIPPSDDHEKAFHGRRDVLFAKPSLSKQRIANAFRVAKHYYEQEDSDALLTPSEEARTRTKQAATRFFENAYQVLKGTDQNFPLYQGNKCIGFVAIPNSKLVVIAVSQDRVPEKDATLRKDMIDLIARINEREKALHPGNEKK